MKTWIAVSLTAVAGVVAVAVAVKVTQTASAPPMAVMTDNHAQEAPTGAKQLWTCGMHPQVVQDHPGTCPICHMRLTPMRQTTGGDAHREGPPPVVIDPAVVQNMGVRTAQVTRGPIVKTVRTIGMLEAPEPGLQDISPKVGGWIEKLYANQEGLHVAKGDPLFDLYSPDLIAAGQELVGAVKSLRALGDKADPPIRQSAETLVASTRRRLALLDVSEADIDGIADRLVVPRTITFRSPSAGAVVDKAVVQGSSVQASAKLMRIEDHSALWLDLQVYEDQMALVTVGQRVDATVAAWPGRTFQGTITFIHPHVDHMSRTTTARVTLENTGGVLLPGMYASATIYTRPVEDAVQVPREAIIDTGTRQIAFVAASAGHFEPRNVRMGIAGDDGRVQILGGGLAVGEAVVTSGQFLFDVESRTTEAIEKLRSTSVSGESADAMPATPAIAAPMVQEAPAAPPPPDTAPAIIAAPGIASTAPLADSVSVPTTASSPPASPIKSMTLTVAYCPMKKSEWLQLGDRIANPFFGSTMLDCGEVRRKLTVAAPSSLAAVTEAYLRVGSGLASDKFDETTKAALRTAAEGLAEPALTNLKAAALKVASAPDIEAARSAFIPLSEALIRATQATATTPAAAPNEVRP